MLKVEHLTKVFNADLGDDERKVALDDVSLEVQEGEFVTIIGGNGSGKSTLMNLISGVYEPDQGTIMIDGVDVTGISEHKRAPYLGRVFQDPRQGTATSMSLIENLELAYRRGEKRGLKWGFAKDHKQAFIEMLASLDLGLEDRLNSKIGLFSGGQRQAVTLLMATLKTPKLLLLDEHTAALDPKTAKKVLDLTDRLVGENHITTLMITHNMRDAIRFGNRLIMLNGGKIVLDISGEEKQKLTIEDLLQKFESVASDEDVSTTMLFN